MHATFSKTDFLNYLVCPGYAWHARHRPELLPAADASSQRRRRDVQRLESLAHQFFPNGIAVPYDQHELAVRATQVAMAGTHDILYQATVISPEGYLARADVLLRDGEGWHLIEIKSSSATPEKPKDLIRKHLPDITFQRIAFTAAGVPLTRVSILALNRTWRRQGAIAASEAFVLVDATAETELAEGATLSVAAGAAADLRDADHPLACDCHRKTRANRCPLFGHFHPDIPDSDTVYNIASIQKAALLPALDRHVMHIADWPDDLKLSAKQRRQVALARQGEEVIHHTELSAFLNQFTAPYWFLDYETVAPPLPAWDGYVPHQQVPFQYSLHEHTPGGSGQHHDYLCCVRDTDPVPDLLASLGRHLGKRGTVIVWNKSFERDRNLEMAARYPAWASMLHDINARMIDLGDAVSKGWWEHPAFQGSWSLKRVLPVVAPDLDYDRLEIGDGGTASERWTQAILDEESGMTVTEREAVFAALRTYCHHDTVAMLRIWEYLQRRLVTDQRIAE